MKIKTIWCTVLCITLIGVGCGKSYEATTNSGPDKTSLSGTPVPVNAASLNANGAGSSSNSSGANTGAMQNNFWTEAAVGGMAEVELGRLASTKAQDPGVKRYGQMMVTDHTKANDELKSLAAKKNVTLPTTLDAKHQSAKSRLEGLSGAEFDRAYVEQMVMDHEATVQLFEKQSGDASDPEAKAFAAKSLPTLQKHLEEIKAIQAKLK
jgi:putative membrane protein